MKELSSTKTYLRDTRQDKDENAMHATLAIIDAIVWRCTVTIKQSLMQTTRACMEICVNKILNFVWLYDMKCETFF